VKPIKAIVAVDSGWGIGYKGALLARVPEDQRFFKAATMGGTVIMGRATFESLPGREPLPGRKNIVLTKKHRIEHGDVLACGSLEELFRLLKLYDTGRCFAIGGESVYTQLLPFCAEAVVTKFHKCFKADRHFPNLDFAEGWFLKGSEDMPAYNGLGYSRDIYVNPFVKEFHAAQ
jgi:dihydrofolate reductase